MAKKWLIIILIIAAFFRLYRLTSSPPGLNWDEVSIGYNAYSVLKTGRDEWGKLFPLTFKAFGEQKLPGMIYASVPGIALFGTTDLGVRITPAVIGTAGVAVIFLLARSMAGNAVGLVAAALLAISPWGVHFSRVSFEAGLAMVLTMLSVYFLTARGKRHYLWFAMVAAVLAAYTYNSVRIVLPLLFLAYLMNGVIERGKGEGRRLFLVAVTGILLLTPLIVSGLRPEGRVRWGTVNIVSQKGFTDTIAESRGYTTLPSVLPRLIHNKATHYVYAVGSNYIRNFSTEFLILEGSSNTQRSIQGMGLLYLFELPLLILGIMTLLREKKYKVIRSILIPWLLIAPVASALTIDSPSSVRSLGMLPALLIIEAIGALSFYRVMAGSKIARISSVLFIVWNVLYFGYLLWYVYPVKYADSWIYGSREVFTYARDHEQEYDRIFVTAKYGEPYIYTLFYTGYDPHTYQTGDVRRSVDPTGWVHVEGFGKYTFTNYSGLETPEEIISRTSGTILMIGGFTQLSDQPKIFEVRAPNWKSMFEVAEAVGAQTQ